ncbi:hypothetical protein DLAC_04692 [Tieghemostelium lacteum]|uniref:Condensin-2 complex subunit H2 n=1 Tax=Tieghemostelium lacteum TaxID=361077 RepID=A0A151ZKS6_TIELA|nr:hypothetical protein DLAC_04692 [Tieghemostelium lacteum]|eukprot:KYQ94394.1 hypothetical protein DLAC_04692 [Tieghemostelium lacteum]
METDHVESKFAYLLQPIKDLADNWNIDISKELDEYLQDLSNIEITVNAKSLNFAEAALLIQGSAVIYSKKVEYLYNLIYQTMEFLNKKKKRENSTVDENGNDKDANFDSNEPEFLPLDDIQEAKDADIEMNEEDEHVNINTEEDDVNLSHSARKQRNKLKKQQNKKQKHEKKDHLALGRGGVSIELMATMANDLNLQTESIEGSDIKKSDFKMNTLQLGTGGALLFSRENQANLLMLPPTSELDSETSSMNVTESNLNPAFDINNTIGEGIDPNINNNNTIGGAEVSTVPAQGQIGQSSESDDEDDHGGDGGGGFDMDYESSDDENKPDLSSKVMSPEKEKEEEKKKKKKAKESINPWVMLDEHEEDKRLDRPLKKNKTYQIPESLLSKDKSQSKKSAVGVKNAENSIYKDEPIFSFATESIPLRGSYFSEFKYIYDKVQTMHKSTMLKSTLKKQKDGDVNQSSDIVDQRLDTTLADQSYYLDNHTLNQTNLDEFDRHAQEAEFNDIASDDELDNGMGMGMDGDDSDVELPVNNINNENGNAFGNNYEDDQFEDDNNYNQDGIYRPPSGMENVDISMNNVDGASANRPNRFGETTSYEAMVEFYVKDYMQSAEQYIKESAIMQRINEWNRKITPILEDRKNKPEFNMKSYSKSVLKNMKTVATNIKENPNADDKDLKINRSAVLKFSDMIKNQPSYEICRQFTSCLQLINYGNIQIVKDGKNNSDFGFHLLSLEDKFERIDDFELPSTKNYTTNHQKENYTNFDEIDNEVDQSFDHKNNDNDSDDDNVPKKKKTTKRKEILEDENSSSENEEKSPPKKPTTTKQTKKSKIKPKK